MILYYGYTTQKLWINAVDPANAQKEAIKLTGDTAEYTISGLVLTKLNYDFTNKVSTSLIMIIIKQYLLLFILHSIYNHK